MNLNVSPDHYITLTNMGGAYVYQIKKRAKYKLTIPGHAVPIFCHNASSVSIALKEHGRKYTISDVYNLFWRRKGCAEDVYKCHRSKKRLNGATIEKLYAPASTSPPASIIPSI